MPALSYYSNVHNTALAILKQKGYRVWYDDENGRMIWGEKNGWDFLADDPVQLLGLVSIYEHSNPSEYSEYWWKIDEPWLLDGVDANTPDYNSVINKK